MTALVSGATFGLLTVLLSMIAKAAPKPKRQDDIDYAIRTIETFADGLTRDFHVIAELNKAAASRLVWFVGIAGLALLNVRSLASAIVGSKLSSNQLLLLSSPWALTAVFGVLAHWSHGELTARDNAYYIVKQHAIRAFLATPERNPKLTEILQILNVDDTDDEVRKRRGRVEQLSKVVTWLERITFGLLLLSFIWSLVYPAIFIH